MGLVGSRGRGFFKGFYGSFRNLGYLILGSLQEGSY